MEEVSSYIKKYALDLKPMNVKNYAFKKKSALELLNIMSEYEVTVAGGDVVRLQGEKMEYTYDNWSSSKKGIESIKDAIDYIEQYHNEDQDNIYFSIVSAVIFRLYENS